MVLSAGMRFKIGGFKKEKGRMEATMGSKEDTDLTSGPMV